MYAAYLSQKFDCKETVAKGALGLEFVFTIMKDVSLLVC